MILQGKTLKFYDSMQAKVINFQPIDCENIKIYVCGPTVYSRPHLGNARSFVFYDVLFRILKQIYPQVTYIRNITDVDDKILSESDKLGIQPYELTDRVIQEFHEDTSALFCLSPTVEPKATMHINEMLEMINSLLNRGFAYQKDGHVLFSTDKFDAYAALSKKDVGKLNTGARIALENYKMHEHDFVLWKPETKIGFGFESQFGYGRPGWHIECSAMSRKYLGDEFDIHGGGADLKFPHHDNEIAQSVCATGKQFAKYWIHNGFLMVNGAKMSKSLANFITPRDLIQNGWDGRVIRIALLSTMYSKPLDFTQKLLQDSKLVFEKFQEVLSNFTFEDSNLNLPEIAIDSILTDFNTTKYFAYMHSLAKDVAYTKDKQEKEKLAHQLYSMLMLLGIDVTEPADSEASVIPKEIYALAAARQSAKKNRDFVKADGIRQEILEGGYIVEDLANFEFKIKKI